MPKYNPTNEDLYNTKPCFVCGSDVIDLDKGTCCWQCEQQKEIFVEDYDCFYLSKKMKLWEDK